MDAMKPGIYKATVRGVPDQVILVDDLGLARTSDAFPNDQHVHTAAHIHDARPLIVLDLSDWPTHKMLVETLSAAQSLVSESIWDADKRDSRIGHLQWLINQIADQTRPARIPEPGLYGVVEASLNRSRETWLHTINGWSNGYHCHAWSYLIDPTLIRDGIQ